MADTGRVVFPDEVDAVKAAAAQDKTEGGNSNSVEEPPVVIQSRNMITAPANCPAGFEMGADGKCREVFD